jgi:hypothetical protein
MLKKWITGLAAIATLSINFAGDLVLDGTSTGYLNPNWDLVGTSLITKDNTPYIRVNTEGNCHYEWRQKCETLPDGHVNCTTVPEWTCDYRSALFTLPPEVVVRDNEVHYQKDERDIKVGVLKNFLWWKWVKLEENIGVFSDILSARLIIRDAMNVLREKNFAQLYQVPEASISPQSPSASISSAELAQTFTVTGPMGTVTVFYGAGGRTQIRGSYKGVQFNTNGASQIPFTGRSTGLHEGNKFVKFDSANVTITLVHNLKTDGIPASHLANLNRMSPGCVVNNRILTALVMIRPEGIAIPVAFNARVPLR